METGPDGSRGSEVWTAIAFATLGLLWALAAAPRGYAEGDSSELTLALALAGVPHPTGYPLYVLAGHAATTLLHRLGMTWPEAANAWSGMGGAVALFFLHRLASNIADRPGGDSRTGRTQRLWLVTLPLLPLAVQPIWSAVASAAEVYSWHAAWLSIAAWVAWRSATRPVTWRTWGRWGLVVGAGLAHHVSSVFVSAPLTFWLWRQSGAAKAAPEGYRSIRVGDVMAAAAGALVPLVSWSWIAFRALHPAPFQWPLLEAGAAGLLAHVAGVAYGGYFGGFHPSEAEARLLATAIPWVTLSALAFVWTLVGARSEPAPRRRLTYTGAVGLALLLQGAFVLAYRVPDPAAHVVPVLALGAIFIPNLAVSLASRAGGTVALLAIAALLVGLVPASIDYDLMSRRKAEATDELVRAAWERIRFEDGFVFWNNDLYARLRAYQILEGSHPRRVVENSAVLTWDGPRRRFRRLYGFDPWGGTTPKGDEALADLANLARRSGNVLALDFDDAIRAVLATRQGSTP